MNPSSSRYPRPLRTVLVAMAGATALLLAACGGESATETSAETPASETAAPLPVVVATTSILGDITANVVGDLAEVEVIMPPNADPHDFEPSARQAAELRDADVIIANGLLLEEGLISTLESVAAEGVPVVEIAPELDPIPWGGDNDHGHSHDHDDDHGHSHSHDHGDEDPHVWMDPERMATAAALIGDAVVTYAGLDATVVAEQVAAYQAELAALTADMEAIFAEIPASDRLLVTNHEAFGYLADRFGFEIVGTIIPSGSNLAEPGAASLAALVGTINELGVRAIFAENISSTDLAEALARETGNEVVVVELFSDSLGEPGSGGETYIGMMSTNAQRIGDALRT